MSRPLGRRALNAAATLSSGTDKIWKRSVGDGVAPAAVRTLEEGAAAGVEAGEEDAGEEVG